MITSVMLIRLANSWREQARTVDQVEAETLARCAEEIVALVNRGAVNAVFKPVEAEERREAS